MSSSIATSPEAKDGIATIEREKITDTTVLNSAVQTADLSETPNPTVLSENEIENEEGSGSRVNIVESISEQEDSRSNCNEDEMQSNDMTNRVVPQSTGFNIENKQLLSPHVPNARSISSRSNPFDEVTALPLHESKGLPKLEESIFGVSPSVTPKSSVNSETAISRGRRERSVSSNTQGEEFFSVIFRDSNKSDQAPTNHTSQSVSSSTSDQEINVIGEQPNNVVHRSPQHSDASHVNPNLGGRKINIATSDVSNISQSASQSDSLNTSNHLRSVSMDSQGYQNIQQQQQHQSDESNTQALMLGLEQLERQQAEHEARQKSQMNTPNNGHSYLPSTIHVSSNSQQEHFQGNSMKTSSSYEQHPSSQWAQGNVYGNAARNEPMSYVYESNIADRLNPQQKLHQHAPQDPNHVQKIPQLGKDENRATRSFRKALLPLFQYYSSSSRQKSVDAFLDAPKTSISEENENDVRMENKSQAIIYGYLHKLNKSGKWQKRFFETDGQFLTYYKTSKRFKLLATLDLIKVGEISVTSHDTTGCTFQIQVAARPYFLKAENSGICQDWVINLNRVREARFQLGGMKLIAPNQSFQPYSEGEERDSVDRKRSESSSEMVARVTVESNRIRTKRVTGITEYWSNLDRAHNKEAAMTPIGSQNHVLLGWQKRRRNFQIIRSKLASFVRWMKLMKHFAKKNHISVDEDQTNVAFEADRFENTSGAQYRYEEATVEDSELSSRKTAQSMQDSGSVSASKSFDPSRPRLRLQKSMSGGSSTVSNPSMRETEISAEPSPKFSAHENLSFETADYNDKEIEDRGILS